MPYKTGLVFTYDCGDFARGHGQALRARRHRRFRAAPRRGADSAASCAGSASPTRSRSPAAPTTAGQSGQAAIRVDPDGTVTVSPAPLDRPGQRDRLRADRRRAARRPLERVQVSPGRHRRARRAAAATAARARSCVGGSAVSRALDKIIEHGRAHRRATLLEAAPEDIAFADGRFTVAGTDRGVTSTEVARAASSRAAAAGHGARPRATTAAFTPPAVTFPNGCHICEVEIDPETGASRSSRYTRGRRRRPHGQSDAGEGADPWRRGAGPRPGAVRATWSTTRTTGQLLTGSFMDYAMPRADDMPFFDVDSPRGADAGQSARRQGRRRGRHGRRAARVMNAVNDALAPLGVRHLDMPATPERVWRAIQRRASPRASAGEGGAAGAGMGAVGAPAWLACRRNSLRARLARAPHPPEGAGRGRFELLAARSPCPALERRRRLAMMARPRRPGPSSPALTRRPARSPLRRGVGHQTSGLAPGGGSTTFRVRFLGPACRGGSRR